MYKLIIATTVIAIVSACSSTSLNKAERENTVNTEIIESTSSSSVAILSDDPNWHHRYSPDVPYYNRTTKNVPAKAMGSSASKTIAVIKPGEGGFITSCILNSPYCKIAFGGNGVEAYVNMDKLEGEGH